jgi:hypothetical protein
MNIRVNACSTAVVRTPLVTSGIALLTGAARVEAEKRVGAMLMLRRRRSPRLLHDRSVTTRRPVS